MSFRRRPRPLQPPGSFPALGEAGQRSLMASRVTICGCGALGTVLANHLVRAGVGHVRIVDRDFIETHNLQRQILFDEARRRRQPAQGRGGRAQAPA